MIGHTLLRTEEAQHVNGETVSAPWVVFLFYIQNVRIVRM